LAADPDHRFTNVQEILDRLDRRAEMRARRPLMLLGILGPILLLLATSIYAARTIDRASEGTKEALREEAFSSNQLSAKYAARTLESELERYFRLTRDELNEEDFRQSLSTALSDNSVKRDLKIISDQGTSELAQRMTQTRESILDLPARLELDRYLSGRLAKYTSAPSDSRIPRLASMFVTDSDGTIFGIAYDNPVIRDQNSAGRNYAYRTYYHGQKNDLPIDTPIDSIDPLKRMHLSAAFQSTATGLWKVAISEPVFLSEDPDQGPDAVFVVTINLGDFELLQGETGANQVAVLVEAREGPMRGTVLQHPYMETRHKQGKRNTGDAYKVDAGQMNDLLREGLVDYRDPIAEAPGAEGYTGEWIAAMQPVRVPGEASLDSDSNDQADLLVLVQYRLSKVFAPVGEMREKLFWEGAAALLASFLFVSGTLWFFVHRVGDKRANGSRKLAAAGQAASETAGIAAISPMQSNQDTSKPVPPRDLTETLQTPSSRQPD
jgi:hypothetical protein